MVAASQDESSLGCVNKQPGTIRNNNDAYTQWPWEARFFVPQNLDISTVMLESERPDVDTEHEPIETWMPTTRDTQNTLIHNTAFSQT